MFTSLYDRIKHFYNAFQFNLQLLNVQIKMRIHKTEIPLKCFITQPSRSIPFQPSDLLTFIHYRAHFIMHTSINESFFSIRSWIYFSGIALDNAGIVCRVPHSSLG
jgi:hypothetical protein